MRRRRGRGVTAVNARMDAENDIKKDREDISMKKWVCPVCGYVHEGDVPPEKCPLCGVPGSKFVEQAAERTWAA